MQPVELVPGGVDAGVVVAAEPPEPVAALGDEHLAVGARVGVRAARGLQGVARGGEQVPGAVVLRVADPGGEAGVDPRPAPQAGQRPHRLGMGVEEVADVGGAQPFVAGEPRVQLVEERVAVLLVVLPAVLAIQG